MAAAPFWKVYNADGDYLAACVHAEDAAVLVASLGDGATIRAGHPRKLIAWTEGKDGQAGESYDTVATQCHDFVDRTFKPTKV